tara:strand:+ start:235 stop:354 length:120 start_codon:yes stop_codon:yes gene_type:complete
METKIKIFNIIYLYNSDVILWAKKKGIKPYLKIKRRYAY